MFGSGGSDYYDEDYYSSSSSSRNPQGPSNSAPSVLSVIRVNRGGSWYDHVRYLRCTSRGYGYSDGTFNNLGFRCSKPF